MNEERDEAQEAEVPAEVDEAPAQEEPELREISDEELQEILAEHHKWVVTEGKAGTKANLFRVNLNERNFRGTNLKGANLEGANLRCAKLLEANLQGANLQEANLFYANIREANLEGANLLAANLQQANLGETELKGANLIMANLQRAALRRANLQAAKLWDANLRGAELHRAKLPRAELQRAELREAILQDADLTDATGLLGEQLAGANVSGAKLPGDIHKFEGLKTVEEASKNARKIFQVMLLACAYSLLTIFSTKHAALLTNSSSSPLPIIQTGVPIAGFFVVAPIILFAAYLYFHIYLQRLWEGLADLPAIFPDGRPLDKRAYPWLLNGLVRSHFKILRSERPPLSRLQAFVSILLAWCTVPAMLFLFWGRYLPRHHWWGTGPNIALLAASIGFGIFSYRLTRRTLRGEDWGQLPDWKQAWKDVRIYSGAAALGGVVIFSGISLAAISGVGLSIVADLRDAEVSIKPQNWTGQEEKEKEEIALVKGAQLKGADLRRAKAHGAFLVKADLREAKLQNTDLSNADLRGANLQEANLQGANLYRANLQRADLLGADLEGTNLEGADLQGASLWEANLQKADLENANLKEADLERADIMGAFLVGAGGLTASQIKAAMNWELAFYNDEFLKKLGLPPDHNEKLEANLAEPKE